MILRSLLLVATSYQLHIPRNVGGEGVPLMYYENEPYVYRLSLVSVNLDPINHTYIGLFHQNTLTN